MQLLSFKHLADQVAPEEIPAAKIPSEKGLSDEGPSGEGQRRKAQPEKGQQEKAATGLQQVLSNPAIWHARQLAQEQERRQDKALASGHARLDALLPDGGWPLGALTELLVDLSGAGELALLLPALRAVCARERGIALLAPPWLPQAAVWEAAGIPLARLLLVEAAGTDLLWSAEQCLRSGECGAVLLWGSAAGRALNQRALQRLQLAAASGSTLCFLYRSCAAAANPSPAPLRLQLDAANGALQVRCLKRRGATPGQALSLPLFPAHWQSGAAHSSQAAAAAVAPASPAPAPAAAGCMQVSRPPVQLQLCTR